MSDDDAGRNDTGKISLQEAIRRIEAAYPEVRKQYEEFKKFLQSAPRIIPDKKKLSFRLRPY